MFLCQIKIVLILIIKKLLFTFFILYMFLLKMWDFPFYTRKQGKGWIVGCVSAIYKLSTNIYRLSNQ